MFSVLLFSIIRFQLFRYDLQFDDISRSIYFSNFIAFDRRTSQAMLMIMMLTGSRRMAVTATGFVRFEMSLQTLVKVRDLAQFIY